VTQNKWPPANPARFRGQPIGQTRYAESFTCVYPIWRSATPQAGSLELLLITTKQSKRWIIPKAGPIEGLKPAKAAAREAYEEAGVRGAVEEKSIGAFRFQKTLDGAPNVLCEVRKAE